MKREKKNLVPTDDGNVLITVLPDEIKSPKMTAEWEMALNHIAQNTETADEFLNGITKLMRQSSFTGGVYVVHYDLVY